MQLPADPARFRATVTAAVRSERALEPVNVLLVGCRREETAALRSTLLEHGYADSTASTATEARTLLARHRFDVVIVDDRLPGETARRLLSELHARESTRVYVVAASDPDPERAVEWMARGAAAYVRRPLDPLELVVLLDRVRRERGSLRMQDSLERQATRLSDSVTAHQALLRGLPDAIVRFDVNARCIFANENAVELTGVQPEACVGRPVDEIELPGDGPGYWHDAIAAVVSSGSPLTAEGRHAGAADGTVWEWRLVPEGADAGSASTVLCVFRDVTERHEAEQEIARRLREKEVLLREVHHRVKNNLSVISSLLSLFSSSVRTPEDAMRALQSSRDHVQAIGLVHKEMYESEDVSRVNMDAYLARLVEWMARAYGDGRRIALTASSDGITMDLTRAVPCASILSELTANALRHAFPGARRGTVRVDLRSDGIGDVVLTVSDDGVGLPTDAEVQGSLGLTLVDLLAKQLSGSVRIDRELGTRVTVRFPRDTGDLGY